MIHPLVYVCVCVWWSWGWLFGQRQRLKVEIEKRRESRRGSGRELKSREHVFQEVEEEVPRVFFRLLAVVYRLLTSVLSIIKYISLRSSLPPPFHRLLLFLHFSLSSSHPSFTYASPRHLSIKRGHKEDVWHYGKSHLANLLSSETA